MSNQFLLHHILRQIPPAFYSRLLQNNIIREHGLSQEVTKILEGESNGTKDTGFWKARPWLHNDNFVRICNTD